MTTLYESLAMSDSTLEELEARIEAGLETFKDVGKCLLHIRDRRLYQQQGYKRFEDYCQERWGWGKAYAYRQIEAAKTVEIIGEKLPMGDIPQTERQARELAPLVKADEKEAIETWQQLREEHGDKLTAKIIREAVTQKLTPVEVCTDPSLKMAEVINLRPDAALRMSESNEWYTPAKYIESARKVLLGGEIHTDPASCSYANITVQADQYFDKKTDGLTKDWPGNVWLNPPYGGLSGPFVAKLIEQYEEGITAEAILLVNANSTDTKWFQPLWNFTLCFTDHRINFISSDNNSSGSTHGSVFVYLGDNPERFAREFRKHGAIVRRWDA